MQIFVTLLLFLWLAIILLVNWANGDDDHDL